MNLRLGQEQKATLMRAAALKNTDLTDFVLRLALREAKALRKAGKQEEWIGKQGT
jgi:uncharacterized protein (DUF1778 family)